MNSPFISNIPYLLCFLLIRLAFRENDLENEEENNSVDETEEKGHDEKEKTDSIETEKSDNECLKAE